MNREEFDSGVWQEFYDGRDYDWARDEMPSEEPGWTEYDERVLQEVWEMKNEEDIYPLTWEEEQWEMQRRAAADSLMMLEY